MEASQLQQLAEILQSLGGWGIAIIEGFVIAYLYSSNKSEKEDMDEQFIEILKETTAMLQENAFLQNQVREELQKAEARLEELSQLTKNKDE